MRKFAWFLLMVVVSANAQAHSGAPTPDYSDMSLEQLLKLREQRLEEPTVPLSSDEILAQVFASLSQRRLYEAVLANLRRVYADDAQFLRFVDEIAVKVDPLIDKAPSAYATDASASLDLGMVFVARKVGRSLSPSLSLHPDADEFVVAYANSVTSGYLEKTEDGSEIDLLDLLVTDSFDPDLLESRPYWLTVFEDRAATFNFEVLTWTLLHEIAHLEQFADPSASIPETFADQRLLELDADTRAFRRMQDLDVALGNVRAMLDILAAFEATLPRISEAMNSADSLHPSWQVRLDNLTANFDTEAAPDATTVALRYWISHQAGIEPITLIFPRSPESHGSVMGAAILGSSFAPAAVEYSAGVGSLYLRLEGDVTMHYTLHRPDRLICPVSLVIKEPGSDAKESRLIGYSVSIAGQPREIVEQLSISPVELLGEIALRTWDPDTAERVMSVQRRLLDRQAELILQYYKGLIGAAEFSRAIESSHTDYLGQLKSLVGQDGIERYQEVYASHPRVAQFMGTYAGGAALSAESDDATRGALAAPSRVLKVPQRPTAGAADETRGAPTAPTRILRRPQRPQVASLQPRHLSVYENPVDAQEMVFLEGGSFTMGPPPLNEIDVDYPEELTLIADSFPVHVANVKPFYIGRTEVTNAQYARFLSEVGGAEPYYWRDARFNAAQLPVVGVSWFEAQAYAKWAGGRLPTEAEWEYAAKAGTRHLQYATPDGTLNQDLVRYGMMYSRGPKPSAAPVRSYAANPFLLYDMSGNVSEWTGSWYQPYPGADVGPDSLYGETYRVIRGGSYENLELSVSTYKRYGVRPSHKHPSRNLGFRIVVPADGTSSSVLRPAEIVP